jgi:hypothetical protein
MQALMQVYLPLSSVKEIETHSLHKEISIFDRVQVNDHYGSSIQMEVGVIVNVLKALAQSREIGISEYLDKVKDFKF